MHTKRAVRTIPTLLLLGAALAACAGDDDGGMTITSNSEGIVDVGADAETPASGGDEGHVGMVTVDGIDHTMNQINRCVPTGQTTERIEAVDGIDSLETLNLVAVGDAGTFQMYFADSGARSLTFTWNGDGSLAQTYAQVEGGDWRDEAGTVPNGQLLEVVDGTAAGGAVIDDRELRFELPIPTEASC